MFCRLIAPKWLLEKGAKKAFEGDFTEDQLIKFNEDGYNVYYLPNYHSQPVTGKTVDGADIDVFSYVFADCDLKDGVYADKDAFIEAVAAVDIPPSRIVDSGNGIHVYWKIDNLDAMSFLRFQRRICRLLNTDEAVSKIFQLMRLPGFKNTKREDTQPECQVLYEDDVSYTCEQLDALLPVITTDDEKYCQAHFDKTYNLNQNNLNVTDEIPAKFGKLLKENSEAKDLWTGPTTDRSKSDYRLGHLMYADGFTKDEAASVLVNSAKALQRAPIHRLSYASNIIDKIWTFEQTEDSTGLSMSVLDILKRGENTVQGTRVKCWSYIDNTQTGFRLGHVMGLVAGSGVGKTTMALNIFLGFVKFNPDYDHFFIPLEQPAREIALRWQTMTGADTSLHNKVHVLSNYDEQGRFRDLSLNDIKEHILEFTKTTGKKVGCVVIDHIGVLCNNNKLGQDEGVKEIAKAMKGFAEETKTFLIMQSQTAREKAGIGDLELNKDAAFGTSVFENFCDYLVTLWQPLKRMYKAGAPTVLSYKFCKIRHKKQGKDLIMEDVPYSVFFEPETERVRELTEEEQKNIPFWVNQSTNKRKQDRKTELIEYTSIKWDDNDKS